MKFPGRKLLHQWHLASAITLEDVLKPCQQVGLNGFAELHLAEAEAMVFYYRGAEVSAVFRKGSIVHNGTAAFAQIRENLAEGEGSVAIYELPLDLAHLLRGLSKRQKREAPIRGADGLTEILDEMERLEHTGTVEVLTGAGAAMILIVGGRVSNTYWESAQGETVEKDRARRALTTALEAGEGQVYVASFSPDAWKSRGDTDASRKLEPVVGAPETLVDEETRLRQATLERVMAEVPALLDAFLFDLMTGAVLARKNRGPSALRAGFLAQKVPAFALYLRDVVAAGDDEVEMVEISTGRVDLLVAVVPRASEALAAVADRSQPTSLMGAAVLRQARAYGVAVAGMRTAVGVPR